MERFKDSVHNWRTVSLFRETANQDKTHIEFSLRELGKAFIDMGDPTGYEFCKEFLGGWLHWKAILRSAAIRPYIEEWQEELEVKLRAEALQNMMQVARSEKPFTALKYIVEGGWKPKVNINSPKKLRDKENKLRDKLYDEFSNVKPIKRS